MMETWSQDKWDRLAHAARQTKNKISRSKRSKNWNLKCENDVLVPDIRE